VPGARLTAELVAGVEGAGDIARLRIYVVGWTHRMASGLFGGRPSPGIRRFDGAVSATDAR
jgi:hypothetical protein